MLVEFRVKNFRSIRTEQRLSLVANKDKSHQDTHLIKSESAVMPCLLKTAVLYGPNASGKSNLINALACMRHIVETSALQVREGQLLPVVPFKLDQESNTQPCEFELTFIDQNIRYQYGFSLTPERVIEEWLLVYEAAKPQTWFKRHFDAASGKDKYDFGSHLMGQRALWQKSTRGNALFLSKAVDLNSEKLRPIFRQIVENLLIFPAVSQIPLIHSVNHAQTETGKQEILNFLASADLGIEAITFTPAKLKQVNFNQVANETSLSESDTLIPQFVHRGKDSTHTFEFLDESAGTQRLFTFASPIFYALKQGYTLVIDELENSWHALIIRSLINQFHSTNNNPKGAQLIFSTHDTSLLDKAIFRRDQIWFVEKDHTQATTLYPFTDFSPRKKEAFDRGYLTGRYGALPFLTDFELFPNKS